MMINSRNSEIISITGNPESVKESAPNTDSVMEEFHIYELNRLFQTNIPYNTDHLPKEKEIIEQYGSNRIRIEPFKKIPMYMAVEMFRVTSVYITTNPILMVPNCAMCCDKYQICPIHENTDKDTVDTSAQYMRVLRAIYLLVVNADMLSCFVKFRKARVVNTQFEFEKCCERRICTTHTPNLANLWNDVLDLLNESKKIPLNTGSNKYHTCAYVKGTCHICRDDKYVNEFIIDVYESVKKTIASYAEVEYVFEPKCYVPFKLVMAPKPRKVPNLNPYAAEFKPSRYNNKK